MEVDNENNCWSDKVEVAISRLQVLYQRPQLFPWDLAEAADSGELIDLTYILLKEYFNLIGEELELDNEDKTDNQSQ